ncbi:MAG: aspartate kinase [Anaerolineales bacterium]|nr:aspartate kinase [Anaerolineales bacterium]
MTTLIMKFGGTSVGSVNAHLQAAGIILDQDRKWDRLVVVVSAMSGVTDLLIQGARTASQGDDQTYQDIAEELSSQHYQVVEEVLEDQEEQELLRSAIDQFMGRFAVLCNSINVLGELTPRALDTISSFGERINARILAAILRQGGLKSEAVDSTELIITDDKFQNAVPLMDQTRSQIELKLIPRLDKGEVPVVTGFIAATESGITTTLGRGGSDYSASILGVSLEADEVWIWTDVDGVMTSDPKIVPEAKSLPLLSYNEISELAYFGAKVVHPRTIQPVVENGIPLRVKNTANPTHPGTLIGQHPALAKNTVKAVTLIEGLSMVNVEGRGMMGVPGIAARTFAAVASQGASVLMITQASSEQSISFFLPMKDTESVLQALMEEMARELARKDIEKIWSTDHMVIVTAVGAGLRETPGIGARIFGALAEVGINVIAVAQGSSECSISLAIAAKDAEHAVRQIHTVVLDDSGG